MVDNEKTVFVNQDKAEDSLKQDAELEQTYMELGKQYYEGKFEDPLPELLPLFDRITRLKKLGQKKTVTCPSCGMELDVKVKFCGHCGCRIQ